MSNPNMMRVTPADNQPAPRPYIQRSVNSLLYLKAALEQEGELVPLDVLSALSAKGVIV